MANHVCELCGGTGKLMVAGKETECINCDGFGDSQPVCMCGGDPSNKLVRIRSDGTSYGTDCFCQTDNHPWLPEEPDNCDDEKSALGCFVCGGLGFIEYMNGYRFTCARCSKRMKWAGGWSVGKCDQCSDTGFIGNMPCARCHRLEAVCNNCNNSRVIAQGPPGSVTVRRCNACSNPWMMTSRPAKLKHFNPHAYRRTVIESNDSRPVVSVAFSLATGSQWQVNIDLSRANADNPTRIERLAAELLNACAEVFSVKPGKAARAAMLMSLNGMFAGVIPAEAEKQNA